MPKSSISGFALLVGAGRWGTVMAKVLVSKGYRVNYVTRNGQKKASFENTISSKRLSHGIDVNIKCYDLIAICVKPKDIYDSWQKYKEYGETFLIEKPGPISEKLFNEIILQSQREKKYVLFNYEFFYVKTSEHLRRLLAETKDSLKEINVFWQKPLLNKGGLEWRLIPHMLSDLYQNKVDKLDIEESSISLDHAKIKGILNHNIRVTIEIKNGLGLEHYCVYKMKSGGIYYKDRQKLEFNEKIISKNNSSSIDNMIDLVKNKNEELALNNYYLGLFILKIIKFL